MIWAGSCSKMRPESRSPTSAATCSMIVKIGAVSRAGFKVFAVWLLSTAEARGHGACGINLLGLDSKLALLGGKLEELVTASIHTCAIDVANLALCGVEISSPCASTNGHVAAAERGSVC